MKKTIILFVLALGFFAFSTTSVMAQLPKPTQSQQKKMEETKDQNSRGVDDFLKDNARRPSAKNNNSNRNGNCSGKGKHSSQRGKASKGKHGKGHSKNHNHRGHASKANHNKGKASCDKRQGNPKRRQN